ncbi:MAG: deoxyribose-phosphate aldolase [Bacteroidetes bacterium]|nr:deoxyribose-phosphate aldolase [Bacteroidota bacterium]
MDIAKTIDHTLLKPDCTLDDIKSLCEEALQFGFASVCIPPYHVKGAVRHLDERALKVATVIGFPMGYSTTPAKVEEIKRAISDGAEEVDIVINICAVKSKDWNYVQNDIASMTRAAHLKGKIIKVILETGLLQKEEIIHLCEICASEEVDFVKTSTGLLGAGASVEIIQLLRSHLPEKIKIKASGGIRTLQDTKNMLLAGAQRIGSSSGVKIMNEL